MTEQHWVSGKKLYEIVGITEDAAKKKRYRGIWQENYHWVKGPDNRIYYELIKIFSWIKNGRKEAR